MKHFQVNSLKTSLFCQKKPITEEAKKYSESFVFLNKFEKEQIQR